VHALITDIGSNFLQMSCELGISNKNSVINEQNILYIFDTPHLIKATRNNLLKYNLEFSDKFASWSYILSNFIPKILNNGLKQLLNYFRFILNPTFFQMKVKYAVQEVHLIKQQ